MKPEHIIREPDNCPELTDALPRVLTANALHECLPGPPARTSKAGAEKVPTDSPAAWLKNNLLNPIWNSGAEAYNTTSNVINYLPDKLAHKQLLSKASLVPVKQTNWLDCATQSIASGLTGALVYGAAGKLAGGVMRACATSLRLEGACAAIAGEHKAARAYQLLTCDSSTQVLGAVAYDGLRDLHGGETRLGNMVGSAAAFSLFETFNPRVRNMALLPRLPRQAFIGAGGALAGNLASNAVSCRLPAIDELAQVAASGAFMNTALPGVQHALSLGIGRVNDAVGRGNPMERYMSNKGMSGKWAVVDDIAGKNFSLRIKGDEQHTGIDHKTGTVFQAKDAQVPDLAHELAHGWFAKSRSVERRFLKAQEYMNMGDDQKAWETFRGVRVLGERYARRIEGKTAAATGNYRTVISAPDHIARERTPAGLTYEQHWCSEFEQFKRSGGQFRPHLDYSKSSKNSSSPTASDSPEQLYQRWENGLSRVEADLEKQRSLGSKKKGNSWFQQELRKFNNYGKDFDEPVSANSTAEEHERFDHASVDYDEGGGGGSWFAQESFRFENESGGRESDLVQDISRLPAAVATSAWHEAVSVLAKSQPYALVRTIESLPSHQQQRCLQVALDKLPISDVCQAISDNPAVPCPALKTLVEKVLHNEHPLDRTHAFQNFPTGRLNEIPLQQRFAATQELFQQTLSVPDAANYSGVRSWWERLPEPALELTADSHNVSPVRNHLAATLDPKMMARLVFDDKHWNEALSALEGHPESTVRLRTLLHVLPNMSEYGYHDETAAVVLKWLKSGSLADAVLEAVKLETAAAGRGTALQSHGVVSAMAEVSSQIERREALSALSGEVFKSARTDAPSNIRNILTVALSFSRSTGSDFREILLTPLETALGDHSNNYMFRLSAMRQLASMARAGSLGEHTVRLPSLRMPPQAVMSHSDETVLRKQVEEALLDPDKLPALLGDGSLGRIMPGLFGQYADGGIVGRPQHGGHDFSLDVHIQKVVEQIREHPDFASLSHKDQVNLLWAGFLHDIGKEAGKVDLDHEWVSSDMAWGVLSSLGYPSQRIQRIANLISRHDQVSFNPDPKDRVSLKLADESKAHDLAVFYRHPSAIKQLRILNESDIRSINAEGSHWTPEVADELDDVSQIISSHVKDLSQGAIPILTSKLPQHFGLVNLTGDHVLLAHVSPHIEGPFMQQLASVQTPEYSISATLITPEYRRLFGAAPIFALVAGPAEQVSQANRQNLSTGRGVDWQGHVQLTRNWSANMDGVHFVREIDHGVRELSTRRAGVDKPGSLADLWQRLAQFDTVDELLAEQGPNGADVMAYRKLVGSLTHTAEGGLLNTHNEIKLNNPTMVGVGIVRHGQPVFMENLKDPDALKLLLGNLEKPSWLLTEGEPTKEATVIPEGVWREAMQQRLPLVVLDP